MAVTAKKPPLISQVKQHYTASLPTLRQQVGSTTRMPMSLGVIAVLRHEGNDKGHDAALLTVLLSAATTILRDAVMALWGMPLWFLPLLRYSWV